MEPSWAVSHRQSQSIPSSLTHVHTRSFSFNGKGDSDPTALPPPLISIQRAETMGSEFDLEKNGGPGPTVSDFPEESEPEAIGQPPGPPGGFLCQQMSPKREVAFTFMVCMIQLLPQACLTTGFPISNIVADYFHIRNPVFLPWMVAAYATTFGSFILISGRLGDIFGHKKFVLVGFVLMTMWSLVCGLSHMISPLLFFAARAMEGIAASMLIPNGLALLGRTYPPGSKKKIIAFSLFGLCAPLGAYMGMIFSALFSQYLQWWYTFYALSGSCFLCAIASKVVFVAPPPLPNQVKPLKAKLGDMDWLGAFTGVAGLVCIQVALVTGPAVKWNTAWIPMILVIGLLLIAAFVITEIRIAKYPLVPFKMLKSDVAFVLGAVACGWAVFGIWAWYLWRYLLLIRLYHPVQAAVHVLPFVPVAVAASVLTAYLMRTTKPAFILLYATVAATLGPLFLFFAPPTQTYWGFTFVSILVIPVFMDFCLPAATYIMSNYFPMHMQGVSASLVTTVLNYSIGLGLGLANTAEVYSDISGKQTLKGIRGAWITGVGIGCLGVIICAIFLYRTVLSAKAPMRPPTIREREEAAMSVRAMSIRSTRPQTAETRISIPQTVRAAMTERENQDRGRSSTRLQPKRSGTVKSMTRSIRNLGRTRSRRGSTTSIASSLFPLTRNSSLNRQDIPPVPDWRDRMMPQFEWRQVEVAPPKRVEPTYHKNMTQSVRFHQGRNTLRPADALGDRISRLANSGLNTAATRETLKPADAVGERISRIPRAAPVRETLRPGDMARDSGVLKPALKRPERF